MSFFDGRVCHVRAVTQEILNWLDESDMDYHIVPHLERWRYSGPPHTPNPIVEINKRGVGEKSVNRLSDYRRVGDDILFEKEEDRMHFQLRWAEYIKSEDDPFEF